MQMFEIFEVNYGVKHKSAKTISFGSLPVALGQSFKVLHYENMSMQYTTIFLGCKNVHFQMKFFNIFLIFAQNIDCGYTLEPPQ